MKKANLNGLPAGASAAVTAVNAPPSARRRLADLGLVPGTVIKCVGQSPSGNPRAFLFAGTVIALRNSDCENIIIDSGDDNDG